MKKYKGEITLVKNSRGCYILDTIKGCSICRKEKPNGCYGDCYAKNISARYGFDFLTPTNRGFSQDQNQLYLNGFHDTKNEIEVIKAIEKIDMPFVRIGEMGDPSQDWQHTINICKVIKQAQKPIVIVTKHWDYITGPLLSEISKLGVYINTSISALDSHEEIEHRITQFNKLKNYCNSVLRIVSCDFNTAHCDGLDKHIIQGELFKMGKHIDTIFRPSKTNPLVVKGIINTRKEKFLKSEVLVSRYNPYTYFGDCNNCPDMCGVNI